MMVTDCKLVLSSSRSRIAVTLTDTTAAVSSIRGIDIGLMGAI